MDTWDYYCGLDEICFLLLDWFMSVSNNIVICPVFVPKA